MELSFKQKPHQPCQYDQAVVTLMEVPSCQTTVPLQVRQT